MKILLSIKPEYAQKILNGQKKFEFRKSAFANIDATCVVIYATKPIGKVVGEFDVAEVIIDEPEKIWNKTKKYAGIIKARYDEYYSGRTKAVALAVGEVRQYPTPLNLVEIGENVAPQSFRYLSSDCQSKQPLLI